MAQNGGYELFKSVRDEAYTIVLIHALLPQLLGSVGWRWDRIQSESLGF